MRLSPSRLARQCVLALACLPAITAAGDGRRLWSFNCGAGVNAPPATYELDGEQYVAVATGGNALFGYRQGDALFVFRLPRP